MRISEWSSDVCSSDPAGIGDVAAQLDTAGGFVDLRIDERDYAVDRRIDAVDRGREYGAGPQSAGDICGNVEVDIQNFRGSQGHHHVARLHITADVVLLPADDRKSVL